MINTQDAIRCVSQVIGYCNEHDGFGDWEDDLYSLLDALNEEVTSETD